VDEAEAEHDDAGGHRLARAEAVREPTLDWTQEVALEPEEGVRPAEGRAAPPELSAELDDVATVGLRQGGAEEELKGAATHHPRPRAPLVVVRWVKCMDRCSLFVCQVPSPTWPPTRPSGGGRHVSAHPTWPRTPRRRDRHSPRAPRQAR